MWKLLRRYEKEVEKDIGLLESLTGELNPYDVSLPEIFEHPTINEFTLRVSSPLSNLPAYFFYQIRRAVPSTKRVLTLITLLEGLLMVSG